jgi:hypothetical protein
MTAARSTGPSRAQIAIALERQSQRKTSRRNWYASGAPTANQMEWGKSLPMPSQGPVPSGSLWYDRK